MAMIRRARIFAGMTALLSVTVQAANPPLYRDSAAPVDERIDDLLGRMTLDEKIVQLTTVWTRKSEIFTAGNDFDPAKARKVVPSGIGHMARPSDLRGTGDPLATPYRDATQTVALLNAIQHYAVKETRLGVP